MHCYHTRATGWWTDGGSLLVLNFTRLPRDWTKYTKLIFTLSSEEPATPIAEIEQTRQLINISCYHQSNNLFIANPYARAISNLKIFSLSGRLIYHLPKSNQELICIPFQDLSKNGYILKGNCGSSGFSKKITIVK